jgi:zinc protease
MTIRHTQIETATRHVLPNGMVVLVQRNEGTPTVSVRGEVRVGAVDEPAERAGLAAFTGASLIRGTERRTFQEIVATTEALGASVNAGGGMHTSGFGGRALAEDLPLVLEILADMLRTPTFPAQEVERLRGQFLMGLRENEQDTRVQASRLVRSIMFPAGHPYSRLSSGTVETVSAIAREDLAAFHRRYNPAATTVAVVGDVEPSAVIAALERVFADWTAPADAPRADMPQQTRVQGVTRRDLTMPGKSQTDVIWAVHGLSRLDPDYYVASVANMILGRIGLGGRLGENVRERRGLAYYCGSSLETDLGAGPWAALAGVNPANVDEAIEAIIYEIGRFVADGPTPEEMSDAQDYMTGSLVLGLETNDGIAGTLLGVERYGLGLDYIGRYPGIIRSVTAEDTVRVARRFLSTSDYVLVTAGPERGES